MAAAVLGKRSRRHLEDEENLIPLRSSKRRTRQSTPRIYEDEAQQLERDSVVAAKAEKVLGSTRSVRQLKIQTKDSNTRKPAKAHVQACPISEEYNEPATDENTPPSTWSTPTGLRFKDALASPTPSTPKHRVRLIGRLLTPRSTPSTRPARSQNVYSRARQLFTQSGSSKVIGREAERNQLKRFISTALEARVGGCTYVSGAPGTGKSALVHEVLDEFRDQSVRIVTINCVTMKTSTEVLAQFTQEFCHTPSGKKNPKASLSKLFTTKQPSSAMHVVLMDEIDALVSGGCELLYSIFEWAMHPSSSLVLIGIANALDLTDRFLPRLKLKDMQPHLLPFLPYTAQQISSIISAKLRSLLPDETTATADFVPLMQPAAIQLSGKKIASQTGDLRKAFGLVRRAIDQVEQETLLKMSRESSITPTKQPLSEVHNASVVDTASSAEKVQGEGGQGHDRNVLSQLSLESAPRVTIAHVAKIASSFFNNSAISRLNGLNLQQKAVLCSLVASENRNNKRDPYKTPSKTWSKVATIKGLYDTYGILCKRDEGLLQPLKNTEFRDVVASLETLGLVHEAVGRMSSLLTPSSTPSRSQRGVDDKQVVSAVSEKEMRDSLAGPGADLLQRLLDEE